MATEDLNNTLMQDYYLPESSQDANSATWSAFIMFSVFVLVCIIFVSFFT